jgi:poly(ADP-ribose) glycohydrolase ARH3
MPTADKFAGCLLGLALGDALGAPFEGGPVERLLWRVIGRTREGRIRWTDDTQMSLDFAESLIANAGLDPDDLAARFARSYRWSRGYGPGVAKLLRRIAAGATWRDANHSVYPNGSFGNGGAMRAAVGALFYGSRREELVRVTRDAALITHAHPLGIEGAVLVAIATAETLSGTQPLTILKRAAEHCLQAPFVRRLETADAWLKSGCAPTPHEVRSNLGNGITAAESCVTAVYVALRYLQEPFLELQTFVADCGGDVDTIGAMSGALWGAANGISRLPESSLELLEDRERIQQVAEALHNASVRPG